MADILVTGGEGFIGKHIVAALKEHHDVTVLEHYGYSHNPKKRYDGIIHLAAVSRVKHGEADHYKCMEVNVLGTILAMDIPHDWFIFASTMEKPTNVYGLSKSCAEKYINMRGGKNITLRLANVIGPGMAEDKLLPQIRSGNQKPEERHVPFEYIHVDDVVAQVKILMNSFGTQQFKPFALKLANGIARTPEELAHVAATY